MCLHRQRVAEKGWGRGRAGLNGWSQGPHSYGSSQPSSTWLAAPLPVPPCHSRLSSGACRSRLLWGLPFGNAPMPTHPILGTSHNTVYKAWALRAGHSHTCPSDPDDRQYPSRAAKPGKGEKNSPAPVLLLTEVLQSSLGLCWIGNTIWLFPAFLISRSGPLVLPPSLLGLLPSLPNFINVISSVLIILMVLCS